MKRLTYMLVLGSAAIMLCRDAALLAVGTNPEARADGQHLSASR